MKIKCAMVLHVSNSLTPGIVEVNWILIFPTAFSLLQ